MGLLSTITNVANEAGYQIDSKVIGSTDPTTKQLGALANRLIQEMGREYEWTRLYASSSITLQTGVPSYALPSAFSYFHYETFWNQSTRWRVLGPMSEQRYAEILGYGLSQAVYSEFQLRGIGNNRLLISPTPGASMNGQTIIFEYMAARYVRPLQWAQGLAITSGAYIFNDGKYYTATNSATTGATPPTHTAGTVTDGAVNWAYYAGAYETFLADTDEPIFNQTILELGILERFREGKDLSPGKPRFEDKLLDEYSRDFGGKTLYAGGRSAARQIYARSGQAVFGNLNLI